MFRKLLSKRYRYYLDKHFSPIANLDDIYACFRIILGRPPSQAEWTGHSCLAGNSLVDVVNTYISSKEFRERNLDYLDLSEIAEVDMQDYKMVVPKNDPQVGSCIFRDHEYEVNITRFVETRLNEGDAFLDLGANIGHFSMVASHIVGESGKVLAVEPGELNTKFLLLNQQINEFHHMEIFSCAASDKKGLSLYDTSGSNGFISKPDCDLQRTFGSTIVNTVVIDELFGHLNRLEMIKVDIEGAEYLALKGAEETIRKFEPIIISEFSPPALASISDVSAEHFLAYILDLADYEMYYFKKNELVACGRSISMVKAQFLRCGASHINIVFMKPV